MSEIIFLTGLPRSGTKLLRDLMNNHSKISIPRVETVMIPYLVNKYGLDFDLTDRDNFKTLIREFEQSSFYHLFSKSDIKMDLGYLQEIFQPLTWSVFFEEILKYYGPKQYSKDIIIGDKTPGYIDHSQLILALWPNARFIHIVRDPRDYVCSVSKVWHKNIYRAANRWNRTMVRLQSIENLNNKNLHTVYYETLLDHPKLVMTGICSYLSIDFEESMLTLKQSSEQHGAASGHTTILQTNKKKYLSELTRKQIIKVEQLVCEGARIHNYSLDNPEVKPVALSKVQLASYKLMDGYNALRFHISKKGFKQGAEYFFRFNKTNIKRSKSFNG